MIVQELRNSLQELVNSSTQLGANLYFLLKSARGNFELRRVSLSAIEEDRLRDQFLTVIETITVEIDNQELLLAQISSINNRVNTIYEYNYSNRPEELLLMEEVSNASEILFFNFEEDSLEHLKGFLLYISNDERNILIYKQNYSFNLFKNNKKHFMFCKSEQRFEKLDGDIFRLDFKIDLFYINNSFYVINLDVFEKSFAFKKIIVEEAQKRFKQIESMDIVDDIKYLQLNSTDNFNFAKKLAKISLESPILKGNIPNTAIINFINNCPALKDKLKLTKDGSKIRLTKSSTNLFLKVLNDDVLQSELTRIYYDSSDKSIMQFSTNVNELHTEPLVIQR